MNNSTSCMDRLFRNFQPNQFSPSQRVASKTYLVNEELLVYLLKRWDLSRIGHVPRRKLQHWTWNFFTITDYSSPPALLSIISLSLSTDDWVTPQFAVMHVRQGERAVCFSGRTLNDSPQPSRTTVQVHVVCSDAVQRLIGMLSEFHLHTHSCFIPLLFS